MTLNNWSRTAKQYTRQMKSYSNHKYPFCTADKWFLFLKPFWEPCLPGIDAPESRQPSRETRGF